MSYLAIYTLEFPDYYDRDIQVLIEKKDYAGASTDIIASENPVTVTFDTPSDFILDPINGSTITLRLMSETDFQFLDLYSNSNREYRVTLNIDTVLSGRWFIQPDQYQEEYVQTPYATEFIASDQLGFLKTLTWDNTSTLVSFNTVLNTVLGATGLGLNLYESLNVYEDSNNKTTADSPLNQNWFDANVYSGKSYYDVLAEVLTKFSAVIKQDRGAWVIYRPSKSTAAYQRRLWTWSGTAFVYDSTASYSPVVLNTSPTAADLVRITAGSMFTAPAWKGYTINQSLQKKENIVVNGDFTSWTSGKLNNWVRTGAIAEIQSGDRPKLFAKATHNWSRFISNTISTLSDRFKVKVSWNVFVAAGSSMDIYFDLTAFGTAPTVMNFDFNNFIWAAFPPAAPFKRTYDNSAGTEAIIQTDSIELITPRSVQVFQSLLQVKMFAPVSATTTNFIVYESIVLTIMKDVSVFETEEFVEEQTFPVVLNSENNFTPDDTEIICADVPSDVLGDASNIYLGALFSDAAKVNPTRNWTEDDGVTYKPLISLMQDVRSEIYANPQQVISVPIFSKILYSTSIIQEINNANRLFMIKRATWDILNGIIDVEAFEIGISAGTYLIDENDATLTDENNQSLIQ